MPQPLISPVLPCAEGLKRYGDREEGGFKGPAGEGGGCGNNEEGVRNRRKFPISLLFSFSDRKCVAY